MRPDPVVATVIVSARVHVRMGSSPRESAEAVVRRFFEAFNAGDRASLAATLADDFVFRSGGGDHDAASFVDVEFAYLDAFPDLTYTIDDLFSSDGLVAVRWTFAGTHEGRGGPGLLGDVEPTGREVEVTGLNAVRIEDGAIAELWGEWNGLGLHSQLGLVELVRE